MRTAVRRLSIAATVGMFVVLVMGATVTNTGSGEGCGRSWPLCHGQFIPEFAVATLIELSHRAVTGVEGVLIVALTAGVLALWRQHLEIRVLAPLMLGSLLLQAGMGAWAVLYPQVPAVLATHFGISLVAFASVFLTASFIYEVDRIDLLRDREIPPRARWAVWGIAAYVHVVVYLGAFIRHTRVEMACFDWPLCNGQLFPGFEGPVGFVFAHRLAALGSVLLLGALLAWAWPRRARRPDLAWGSLAAFALVVLQALSGGLIVLTRADLFSALAHAGIMSLLFASLAYLCLHVVPRPRLLRLRAPQAGERRLQETADSLARL